MTQQVKKIMLMIQNQFFSSYREFLGRRDDRCQRHQRRQRRSREKRLLIFFQDKKKIILVAILKKRSFGEIELKLFWSRIFFSNKNLTHAAPTPSKQGKAFFLSVSPSPYSHLAMAAAAVNHRLALKQRRRRRRRCCRRRCRCHRCRRPTLLKLALTTERPSVTFLCSNSSRNHTNSFMPKTT